MYSALTELMMRDHAAELQRSTDRIVLPDGRWVALRPLRREDRNGLVGLFARLSSESRRRRFLTAKTRLTGAELDHLSDVGHPAHEAMAAIDERDASIIGVSRYVADPTRPGAAELAIAVADDFQNRRVGTALAERIITRAHEHRVATLTATTYYDNAAARALLRRFGFNGRRGWPGELELELQLCDTHAGAGQRESAGSDEWPTQKAGDSRPPVRQAAEQAFFEERLVLGSLWPWLAVVPLRGG
jgi:RimJ/RimL family protein N-acetyltransferase